jgi:hypothetical protein
MMQLTNREQKFSIEFPLLRIIENGQAPNFMLEVEAAKEPPTA